MYTSSQTPTISRHAFMSLVECGHRPVEVDGRDYAGLPNTGEILLAVTVVGPSGDQTLLCDMPEVDGLRLLLAHR